jgi:GMP synthase (glutamine-hydrolysing)
MRRALALNHLAFEDLGSLGTELMRAGYTIDTVDACTADLCAIDPLAHDLLIILGGPIGVYEHEAYPFLHAEMDLIRSRLTERLPTIGICLGAQLIAASLGASVYPGTQGKEIGWAPIKAGTDTALHPSFSELLIPGLRVLHWHGDTFDLPANAQHLASTASYQNQAFAIGQHALGLQFHPEVTAQNLERWYVGHACELAHADISVAQLREDSRIFAPKLEAAAKRFWQSWLSGMAS